MARKHENNRGREQRTSTGLALPQGLIAEPQFLYIPTTEGDMWYKAEAKIRGGSPQNKWETRKINYWMAPDRRIAGQEMPHNHPWEFTAHILQGRYVEQRYWLSRLGAVKTEKVTHKEGGKNEVGMDVYHEVIDVDPGTLTMMVCRGEPKPWGYLDVKNGETWESNDPSKVTYQPGYFQLMKNMNPHHPNFK